MRTTLRTLVSRFRRRLGKRSKHAANQRGVALLMALVSVSLLTFIALEVGYDTTVDFAVARQQVDRLRAYYAAKSGMELSLLRIMVYKQAVASLGASLGSNMLDPIWSFPFMWPPTAGMDKVKMTGVDQDTIKEAVDKSLMVGQFATTITPEGGKIDINDLGSDIKGYQKLVSDQVLKIFQSQLEHNDEFRRKYGSFRFEELVNNMADYIDEDSEGRNGGDEVSAYRNVADKDIKMPPNHPFRTLDELHQVALMNDEFYDLLAPRVTIYGTKGININYAGEDVLMSLDPSMTKEAVQKVIERRSNQKLGGPFKSDDDFFGFLQGYGVNTRTLKESKIPFLYEAEYNFRVVSTGLSSNVKREITAVTYDFPNLSNRLADLMNKEDQTISPGTSSAAKPSNPTTNPPNTQAGGQKQGDNTDKQKIQAPKGRPTVVYWEEN